MARLRTRSPLVLALLAVAFFAAAFPASTRAHELKLSVSEVTYNADTQRLEVALRTYPDDLEGLLATLANKEVALDKPDEVAKVLTPYLKKNWLAKPVKGAAQPVEWSGMDVTDVQAWLFFEIPLPGGVIGAKITNTFMQDSFPEQLNTVRVRDGKTKILLSFPPGTGELVVAPSASTAKDAPAP